MNPFASLLRRSRQRLALNALLDLDDRLLRDIGLDRSDVLRTSLRRRRGRPAVLDHQ